MRAQEDDRLVAERIGGPAPRSALLMTMSVTPNRSRMSKTGTPAARNAALW